MYGIYKDKEYFGVWYNDIEMAVAVALIFERTLGKQFNVKEM